MRCISFTSFPRAHAMSSAPAHKKHKVKGEENTAAMATGAAKIIRRIINTARAPSAVGPYNQAVVVDRTVYVSGQIGLLPETMKFSSEDTAGQAKQALTNMGAILEEAGSCFKNVVKVMVLLDDINDFAQMNEVYKTFFTEDYPARAAYQAANLPLVVKYTNVAFETDESVLFIEVSSIQRCPDRERDWSTVQDGAKIEIEAIAMTGDIKDV